MTLWEGVDSCTLGRGRTGHRTLRGEEKQTTSRTNLWTHWASEPGEGPQGGRCALCRDPQGHTLPLLGVGMFGWEIPL